VLFFPLPDCFNKGFATQFMTRFFFFCQLPFNDHLGGNTGVIGAWHPESVVALHALPADQNVLKRSAQRVAVV